MSRLTGQSDGHEQPSCGRTGEVEAGSPITNCWQAKNFSFSVDFSQIQVTLDQDLRAPSHQNEERLAGQVVQPGDSTEVPAGRPCPRRLHHDSFDFDAKMLT